MCNTQPVYACVFVFFNVIVFVIRDLFLFFSICNLCCADTSEYSFIYLYKQHFCFQGLFFIKVLCMYTIYSKFALLIQKKTNRIGCCLYFMEFNFLLKLQLFLNSVWLTFRFCFYFNFKCEQYGVYVSIYVENCIFFAVFFSSFIFFKQQYFTYCN